MTSGYSADCGSTLRLLTRSRNVLVSGPPGTGKSKLLAEVAQAFATAISPAEGAQPVHNAATGVIGAAPASVADFSMPAPAKTNRKVFRTVFHQNSKFREFLTGLAPSVNMAAGKADFRVMKGTLYRASEHAKLPDGAALLIIDEINRGPAVQVFGGAIVAIESDKRLGPDGLVRPETQFFELLDPATGEIVEYALPHDLYILAAMNQADASVEPLDVAFLRRWEPMRLEPDAKALRGFYGIHATARALPAAPTTTDDALEASVRAWNMVNQQISVGRGDEFRIGHGVLMADIEPNSLPLQEALAFLCVGWAKVLAHVEEVFFGDVRGIAAVLNAMGSAEHNPFALEETQFADEIRYRLKGPSNLMPATIYDALRAFAGE